MLEMHFFRPGRLLSMLGSTSALLRNVLGHFSVIFSIASIILSRRGVLLSSKCVLDRSLASLCRLDMYSRQRTMEVLNCVVIIRSTPRLDSIMLPYALRRRRLFSADCLFLTARILFFCSLSCIDNCSSID